MQNMVDYMIKMINMIISHFRWTLWWVTWTPSPVMEWTIWPGRFLFWRRLLRSWFSLLRFAEILVWCLVTLVSSRSTWWFIWLSLRSTWPAFKLGSWISRVPTSSLTLDVILKDVLGNSEHLIVSGVENIKEGATIIRKAGVKMAGSEKAKLIGELPYWRLSLRSAV